MTMARVLLVHWNVREARQRFPRLRAAGHSASVYSEHGGAGLVDFKICAIDETWSGLRFSVGRRRSGGGQLR